MMRMKVMRTRQTVIMNTKMMTRQTGTRAARGEQTENRLWRMKAAEMSKDGKYMFIASIYTSTTHFHCNIFI